MSKCIHKTLEALFPQIKYYNLLLFFMCVEKWDVSLSNIIVRKRVAE